MTQQYYEYPVPAVTALVATLLRHDAGWMATPPPAYLKELLEGALTENVWRSELRSLSQSAPTLIGPLCPCLSAWIESAVFGAASPDSPVLGGEHGVAEAVRLLAIAAPHWRDDE